MAPTVLFLLGLGAIFVSVTIALSVVGVATAERRAIGRSLAAIRAIDSAPAELRKEIARPFAERVLAPLMERMVGLGKRVSGHDTTSRIRHKLDVAGNPTGWNVERVLGLKVLGFAVCLVLSIVVCMAMGLSFA